MRGVKWKWNRGVDYVTLYNLLAEDIEKAKTRKRRCYDSILLIQLRNGARISEAVRAYLEYVKTRKTELYIDISKKKKREQRLMVIPEEAVICEELLLVDEAKLVKRLKTYCRYRFKVNTHSLRYAFITHLLKQGISPALITKITGHSKPDYIQPPAQTKTDEEAAKRAR